MKRLLIIFATLSNLVLAEEIDWHVTNTNLIGDGIELIITTPRTMFITCTFEDKNGNVLHVKHDQIRPPATRVITFMKDAEKKLHIYDCREDK